MLRNYARSRIDNRYPAIVYRFTSLRFNCATNGTVFFAIIQRISINITNLET